MHDESMKYPPIPPDESKNVRMTISVTPEVRDTFQRLAKAASMSTGRAMGEWLGDTIDAATFMAETMEKARAAPRLVAQELHAYALGLGDETGALMKHLAEKGRAERSGAARTSPTPLSNTGVNRPKTTPSTKGRNAA